MAGDLDETFPGAVDAVGGDGAGGGGGECEAGGGGVGDPEYFAAAGGHAEGGAEGVGCGRGVLGLETDSDNVEGGYWGGLVGL